MQKTEQLEVLNCTVDEYELTIRNFGNRLQLQALSIVLGKRFEEDLTDDTLPADLKTNYAECAMVYRVMEQSVANNDVSLEVNGKLWFGFIVKIGKAAMKKKMGVKLRQITMDEISRVTVRAERLQRQNQTLKLKMQKENSGLKKDITKLNGENTELKKTVEKAMTTMNDYFIKLSNLSEKAQASQVQVTTGIDSTSNFSKYVNISGRKMTVKPGQTTDWFPIFLSKNPISNKHFFEIQVSRLRNRYLMLGITIFENKNKKNVFTLQGTVALYLHNSCLYINGSQQEISDDYKCSNGDKLGVRVDMSNHTIIWEQNHPSYLQIATATIPQNIMHLQFYPYIDFFSHFEGQVTLL